MSIQQPDPYWNEVGELLHFEGPNGSTRIVSEKHRTPNISGTVTLSAATKVFGGSSLLIADTNSGLTYPYGVWSDISGSNFFTFECFFRFSGSKDQVIFHAVHPTSRAAGGWCIGVSAANFPYASFGSGVENLLTSSISVSSSTWYHIAFVREETKYTLYLNGVVAATLTTSNAPVGAASGAKIAQDGVNSTRGFAGYIDELRVTRGYARYVTTFAPPTQAFPDYRTTATDPHFDKVKLLCHFDGENGSTTFVDQKGHVLTPKTNSTSPSISNAANSYVFGNTGMLLPAGFAYLESVSGDYTLGTQDFTIECFYRSLSNATNANSGIFALQNAVGGYALQFLVNQNNMSFTLIVNDTTVANNVYGNIMLNGVPKHLALVRYGDAMYVFSGGVRYGPYALSAGTSIDSNGVFRLGNSPSAPHSAGSVIDEFRYTVGVARYTIAFTPPTDPFPDLGIQKLTGTVLDQSGNPVARTVRSYRSSDGMYVDTAISSAVDGGFALRATDTTEHFVVVQDATKNALVYDHIVPVI